MYYRMMDWALLDGNENAFKGNQLLRMMRFEIDS